MRGAAVQRVMFDQAGLHAGADVGDRRAPGAVAAVHVAFETAPAFEQTPGPPPGEERFQQRLAGQAVEPGVQTKQHAPAVPGDRLGQQVHLVRAGDAGGARRRRHGDALRAQARAQHLQHRAAGEIRGAGGSGRGGGHGSGREGSGRQDGGQRAQRTRNRIADAALEVA